REQRHTAQQLRRQPQVRERRATYAGTVERELAAEYLSVHTADGLEEPQVRPPQPLLLGDGDDHRGTWIAQFVHRMPQSGDKTPSGVLRLDGPSSERVPALLARRRIARCPRQHCGEKADGILRDAEEAGTATE